MLIVIDLSKQQVLDAHLKATQQINSTGNLDGAGNITMFVFLEEVKKTVLDMDCKVSHLHLKWIVK